MERLIQIIAIVLLVAFAGYGITNLNRTQHKLELREIELKSTSVKLKELDTRYNILNQQLDNSKKLNQKQLDQLREDKSKLEKDKKELEKQLQAKREAKEREQKAIADAGNRLTGTATAHASGGTKEKWMTAAGIPQSDWQFVNCVIAGCEGVSAEGGWDGVQRWNTAGSGAYGLCQALPGSKMASAGADWETNPVTQLKWCHGYAQQYGGWAKAWQFRKCLGNCWSNSASRYVYKDHTWW